jgi:hypothetical protein
MEALPGYLFRRDNGAGTRWLQRGAEIRFRPGKRPKSFKSGRFRPLFLDSPRMAAISPATGAGRFSRRLFLRGFSKG